MAAGSSDSQRRVPSVIHRVHIRPELQELLDDPRFHLPAVLTGVGESNPAGRLVSIVQVGLAVDKISQENPCFCLEHPRALADGALHVNKPSGQLEVELLSQVLLGIQHLLNALQPICCEALLDRVPAPFIFLVSCLWQEICAVQGIGLSFAYKLLLLIADAWHLNGARHTPIRPSTLCQRLHGNFVANLGPQADNLVRSQLHLGDRGFCGQDLGPLLVVDLHSLIAIDLQQRHAGSPSHALKTCLLLFNARCQRCTLEVALSICNPNGLDPSKWYCVGFLLRPTELLRALRAGQGGWRGSAYAEVFLWLHKINLHRPRRVHLSDSRCPGSGRLPVVEITESTHPEILNQRHKTGSPGQSRVLVTSMPEGVHKAPVL
mmetsp:Transcript_96217/g.229188  ORF Transcript_96217/g.229188 Transcript_96217/m.229188 type:complete len:377 (+) Transcript_96217:1135-2265(+)